MIASIQIGDVLPLRNMRVVIQDGEGWMDFKAAGKGETFVVLLLGTENIKAGRLLDPEKALRELGWHRSPPSAASEP